jgi:hypothetical protein
MQTCIRSPEVLAPKVREMVHGDIECPVHGKVRINECRGCPNFMGEEGNVIFCALAWL